MTGRVQERATSRERIAPTTKWWPVLVPRSATPRTRWSSIPALGRGTSSTAATDSGIASMRYRYARTRQTVLASGEFAQHCYSHLTALEIHLLEERAGHIARAAGLVRLGSQRKRPTDGTWRDAHTAWQH